VRGMGEEERDNSTLLDFRGEFCEGGEEVRGGVGVDEPEVSDWTLPTLMSDTDASSLAPSIMPRADLVKGGDVLADDPNCDSISIPRAVLDLGPIPGTYKAVLVYQFLIGL
jgi:hypothetical protein